MGIKWITSLYGFDADIKHFSVPRGGKKGLLDMYAEMQGSKHTVAIYIPLKTPPVHKKSRKSKGKIVGLVRVLPLPAGKGVDDYPTPDYFENKSYPYGLPCEVALAPDVEKCEMLRKAIDIVGEYDLAAFASALHARPMRIGHDLRKVLDEFYPMD